METSGNFLSTRYHVVIGRVVPTSIISQPIKNMLFGKTHRRRRDLERLAGEAGTSNDSF